MNNDLISREALLRQVRESIDKNPHEKGILHAAHYVEHKHFLKMVDDAPTIDAEPVRHGQWLLNMEMDRRIYPAERVYRGFKCSLCGRKVRSKKEPYCHCGAKMDLEE